VIRTFTIACSTPTSAPNLKKTPVTLNNYKEVFSGIGLVVAQNRQNLRSEIGTEVKITIKITKGTVTLLFYFRNRNNNDFLERLALCRTSLSPPR
jgi:hypothetical protein